MDKNKDYINELVADIECLEPLHKWTNELNIFNILKLDHFEIRHSNMLAWLLNPNENHGLGDKLLRKLLIYATNGTSLPIMKGLQPIDIDLMTFSDVIVEREKDNIDIKLVSDNNKLVLAIENKIFSGEHSDQLNRYREILQKQYGNSYKYVLLFLSPDCRESSDPENWVDVGYDFIIGELNNLINSVEIAQKSKVYIEDYIKIVRRTIMEDTELKNICQKVYFKHKEAFDLIFENLPDLYVSVTNCLKDYLKKHSKELNIEVWDAPSTCYVRFTPKKWNDLYGKMGSQEWCHNDNLMAFEIQNFKDFDLRINAIIGPAKQEFEEYREKIFNLAIAKDYNIKGKKMGNKWKTVRSDVLLKKKDFENLTMENYEEIVCEALKTFLDKNLETIIKDLSID